MRSVIKQHRRSSGAARTLVRLLIVCAAAWSTTGAFTAAAQADGDPGSDVLVYQPLFLASDAGVSVSQQVQLGNLIHQAAKAGFPMRVAIIAKSDDLGAVTALWREPKTYARFLGIELSLAYKGPLLVVMPNGLGFNWPGHTLKSDYAVLDRIRQTAGPGGLVSATQAAVTALAKAHGVTLAPTSVGKARGAQSAASPAHQAGGTVRSAPTSTRALAFLALALLAAAIVAARVLYGRRRQAVNAAVRSLVARLLSHRRASFSLTLTGVAGLLVALFFAVSPSAQPSPALALGKNPVLDPGTSLDRPARDFTLTNQFGQPVSLRSFRGKVVILGFNDSECTTMCPLTTTAMLDAKAMLGAAGSHVQLVGIDANPKATSVEDVASYSEVHGMTHAWDFLTGSLTQLKAVWRDYSIGVEISHNLVDHDPAIFVISPQGQIEKLFLTQQSYAAVGQLGQLLATEASKLLPGHPKVNSHLSYSHIAGISPTRTIKIPRAGGGKIKLGPGHARIVLFFATWDRQITGLAGGLEGLKRYQSLAIKQGLPPLTSIDEGSVEPRGALQSFTHGLPSQLNYPIGVDTSGRLADGYEADGQPWLMEVNATGQIAFYYSVASLGWPTTAKLVRLAKAGLKHVPAQNTAAALAGSPPALASLHHQASEILGGDAGLKRRIQALRGYPVVVNVWASWCTACRAEFNLFQAASARYGKTVAFIGADASDSTGDAKAFLHQHPLSYPSYSVSESQLAPLAYINALPDTIFLNRRGKVVHLAIGQYDSQGVLDSDIATYAKG